jgi:adhesin transport system outer membrane protein
MKFNQIAQVVATLGVASWAMAGMAQTTMNAQQANEQGIALQKWWSRR